MSEKTAIGWTDATWNPWRGCHKVSPACARCYMFREQSRYGRDPDVVVRAAPATFNAPLRWREPRFVFTCSWSDFFVEEADPWRPEAWDIIRRTPHLTYQILTKRPGRIADHLPPDWGEGWPNVWLGISAENNRQLWGRVAVLAIPAVVHFISAEPLLKPLTHLRMYTQGVSNGFDWVIAGGESGPGCRPTDPDWLRAIRDDCQSAGIPFYLKQLGGWPNKRADGFAVLDDRTWTEMPAARHIGACTDPAGTSAL